MDYTYILGIKINRIAKRNAIEKTKDFLHENRFHYITTVNPEFIIEAQKDKEFREILRNADLSLADGAGLLCAAWLFGSHIYRVPGADLTKEILNISEQENYSVYFFIWNQGLSSVNDVKEYFAERNKLKIRRSQESMENGGKTGAGILRIEGQAIEKDGSDIDWGKFHDFKPDILLVGLGSPHQEKLIYQIKSNSERNQPQPSDGSMNFHNVSVTLAMGVGGTFDFLTGKVKRAPKFMRRLGLEWLYRMLKPARPPHNYFYRIKRVLTAVLVFPWNVLKWRVRMIFCYRKGVLAAIINKENKVLICERMDEKGHWQFPQGGADKGEELEDAVKREVYEESGIKNVKIIKKLEKAYRYKFNQPRHIRNLVKSKYGYKGQKHSMFLLQFIGEDNEIKLDNREFVNYQWVAKSELLEELHPVRRKAGKIILKELENYAK